MYHACRQICCWHIVHTWRRLCRCCLLASVNGQGRVRSGSLAPFRAVSIIECSSAPSQGERTAARTRLSDAALHQLPSPTQDLDQSFIRRQASTTQRPAQQVLGAPSMTAHAGKLLGRAPCHKHLWACAVALLLLAALRSYPTQGPLHRPVADAPPPPPVTPAEVPPNCLHLQRVCVDQQQVGIPMSYAAISPPECCDRTRCTWGCLWGAGARYQGIFYHQPPVTCAVVNITPGTCQRCPAHPRPPQIVMMDPAYLPQNEERPLPPTKSDAWKLFFNLPVTAGSNPDVWVRVARAAAPLSTQPRWPSCASAPCLPLHPPAIATQRPPPPPAAAGGAAAHAAACLPAAHRDGAHAGPAAPPF